MGLFSTVTAGQAIGYKEFIPYLEGSASLEECVERLKMESRRYAKRQMTWFRRNDKIKRIVADGKSPEDIFAEAKALCEEFFKPELIWSITY
jgi:tRNA dimethylallyltransferase